MLPSLEQRPELPNEKIVVVEEFIGIRPLQSFSLLTPPDGALFTMVLDAYLLHDRKVDKMSSSNPHSRGPMAFFFYANNGC